MAGVWPDFLSEVTLLEDVVREMIEVLVLLRLLLRSNGGHPGSRNVVNRVLLEAGERRWVSGVGCEAGGLAFCFWLSRS